MHASYGKINVGIGAENTVGIYIWIRSTSVQEALARFEKPQHGECR